MAAGTKVQLRLGDRVVSEAAFAGDELRVGRMRENDLVVNNLAVSRFHAVLRRIGAAFEVEDLGSENGTFVNGVRIRGCTALPPGAEIGIGKHVLTLVSGAEAAASGPRPAKSDAWDAAQTYFAPGLAPVADAGEPLADAGDPAAEAATELEELEPIQSEAAEEALPGTRRPPASLDLPDPMERFAFGEDELFAAATDAMPPLAPAAEFDVPASAAEAPARGYERGAETALFDFAPSADLGLSEPSLARAAGARGEAAPAAPLYAGLIVERGGRIESVAPLRGAELVVGRGATCDLVLAGTGISRRHARFTREGEGVRVVDLGSANGLRVNGKGTLEQLLRVGDVVVIDDYTLTLVLDREPLEQAVRSSAPPAGAASGHRTLLHEAPLASIPERDLVVDADEEKEALVEAERGTLRPRAAESERMQGAWVVEVVLATDSLPPALRTALAELSPGELRLAAELRLRRA